MTKGGGGASSAADGPRRPPATFELGQLATLVDGVVRGDAAATVHGLAPLAAAASTDLSFLTDARHRAAAATCRAAAFLVGQRDADALAEVVAGRPLLVVADAGLALNFLLVAFHPRPARPPAGVHPTAVVAPTATVDGSASLGPYVVVGEGTTIGADAVLHPHVVVGRDCTIGARVVLHPHVVLYDGTELGERVEVHAGVILGGDGFGYASRGAVHHKVPQVGRLVVEADVEIGANSTIDRAMLAETRVGAGTKIDNLVQVGHNVRIGRACILCGQVGIAGSTEIGNGVVLAGQVGVTGHVTVGDGVMVAAKSAVLGAVESGRQVAGIPAVDLAAWRRQVVALARLDRLQRRVRRLEQASGPQGTGEEGGE